MRLHIHQPLVHIGIGYKPSSSSSSSSNSSSSGGVINGPRSVVNTETSINVLPHLMFSFHNIIVKLPPFKISLSLVFKS